ncbi:amidohydrolase [Pseudalkalibacillus sp. A8]|uniref:amidohydrolase n=1 Tax=Pseudalkalibacillus sp. A8 TaxID=3382641 RepID=UPI0038B609C8
MMEKDVLLFTGGTILTMTEEMYAEGVVVKNNRITFVGSLDQCREVAGQNYEVIDLQGQCLVPGFIDPHVHVMMLGMCNTWADISYEKVKNMDNLVNVLKEHEKTLPEGAPIRGFGFDKRKLEEQRYPTSKDLDRVATDRPVQIMNSSGHCNVVNTYLLDLIGIKPDTPDPIGGSFGRNQDGFPNGTLFDSANDYLAQQFGVRPGNHGPNIHMPDTQDNLQKNIEIGQDLLLSAGFTTVNDVQVTKQEMESYLHARDNGLLKIRIELSFLSNYLDDIKKMGICSRFGEDQLTMGSLKLYADGSLISGTAYLSTDYADHERTKGYLFHDPEEFKNILIEAHKYGLQTLTHAQGDGAIELVLQAVETAQKECLRPDIRHRIEHCGLPTKEQVRRIAELEIWPVPQPQHVYLYGNGVVEAIGQEGENYSPYGWFKENGIPIVLSSDTPVAFPNAFEAIYAAITRNTAQGNIVGLEHKIELEEALKGYTIEAAKTIHKEHLVGSIEKGKLADFAILDKNPYHDKEEDLIKISVNETWISGKRVFIREKVIG